MRKVKEDERGKKQETKKKSKTSHNHTTIDYTMAIDY